jgi:hypothetical protein
MAADTDMWKQVFVDTHVNYILYKHRGIDKPELLSKMEYIYMALQASERSDTSCVDLEKLQEFIVSC